MRVAASASWALERAACSHGNRCPPVIPRRPSLTALPQHGRGCSSPAGGPGSAQRGRLAPQGLREMDPRSGWRPQPGVQTGLAVSFVMDRLSPVGAWESQVLRGQGRPPAPWARPGPAPGPRDGGADAEDVLGVSGDGRTPACDRGDRHAGPGKDGPWSGLRSGIGCLRVAPAVRGHINFLMPSRGNGAKRGTRTDPEIATSEDDN